MVAFPMAVLAADVSVAGQPWPQQLAQLGMQIRYQMGHGVRWCFGHSAPGLQVGLPCILTQPAGGLQVAGVVDSALIP